MLTPNGEARRRRCFAPCEHWRGFRWLMDQRGDNWAQYCAFAGDDPASWVCISAGFLDGPVTNCPAGYWKELVPAAPEALAAQQESSRLLRAKQQGTMLGPMLQIALKGQGEASVVGRLEKMVELGILEPEAAAQIAQTIPKT